MTPVLAQPAAVRAVNGYRVCVLVALTLLGVGLLAGLGVWQVERRAWKLDLIEKVDSRIHAEPHPVPSSAASDPRRHEYEHVVLSGTYLSGLDTWVHASTERGAGYWVMTPLRTAQGPVVLVNRGFVPLDVSPQAVSHESTVHLTGLLRVSEPGGAWPRRNDPTRDVWYSRDIPAMAHQRGLAQVAPYFIDVDASGPGASAPAGRLSEDAARADPVHPVPGLTIVQFRNAHLSYALTWFTLAFMTAIAGLYAIRGELVGYARQP